MTPSSPREERTRRRGKKEIHQSPGTPINLRGIGSRILSRGIMLVARDIHCANFKARAVR